MREQLNLRLPDSTIEELRALAGETGIQLADLANLFLRRGVAGANVEALRAWGKALPNRLGRNGGGLSKDERTVMEALEACYRKAVGTDDANAVYWPLGQVAAETRLRPTEVYQALQSLKERGLAVVMVLEADKIDRWGRPLRSQWGLTDRVPESLRRMYAK